MKLHTEQSNIERGGVHGETNFSIKTNALSFKILSSGLYTDPIMAIVRELSCNAYDAHVKANNKNTPFEIHLPNDLEPWFSIKDYGTGLADEDIRGVMIPVMVKDDNDEEVQAIDDNGNLRFVRSGGLYTTYFDSTKTESNDFIGALGLGSKSPFSYTNAFEVVSRFGGKKHIYSIFLNEDGIPTVALMGDIATDEHSGLEVKLTIKREDFSKFREKTASALKYFPIKPKVTGALHFQFDKLPEHRIETKDWMLSSTNGYSYSSFTAVQGNVAYRVDGQQLRDNIEDADLKHFLEHSHVVAFFNIGELDVSANREEIRYDKGSLAALVKRSKQIRDEFAGEVEKKLGAINNKYWYACIELSQLSRELFERENAIRKLINPEKIKNKILKRYIKNDGHVKLSPLRGYDLTKYTLNGYYTKSKRLKKYGVGNEFSPSATTLWVINDVKNGGLGRLREYLNNNEYSDAIVVSQYANPREEFNGDKPVKYMGFKKELSRLREELGNPDIHLISEITDEIIRETGTVRELNFYQYSGTSRRSYYDSDKISWDKAQVNIKDGGLFFPLKFGATVATVNADGEFIPLNIGDGDLTRRVLEFLIKEYNKKHNTDYNLKTIYGLPVATYKKAIKNGNWENIFDFALEVLPGYVDEISFHRRELNTSNILNAKKQITKPEFVNGVKALDNNSEFKKAMLPLIEGKEKYSEDIMKIAYIIETLYRKLYGHDNIDDTPFYNDDAFSKYPMLTLVDDLGYNNKWSVFFDYINLIDRS